ncbi:MAG: glycosyltransferase [Candidatus Atribacteria bacterium]|nr:glycosyltransferase [Candidatus Atribacteria bacterium]
MYRHDLKPKISVLMSIYNEPIEWVSEAIESILFQTFKNYEFLIINDKPDRKENIVLLAEYAKKDRRIKIIENAHNIGLTKSLNKGLDLAQGQYIARMDADDIALPNRLTEQVTYMDAHSDVAACGSYVKLFGDNEKVINEFRTKSNQTVNYLLVGSPIVHPSAIMRKSILDKFNIRYNEDLRFAQDYNFWFMLSTVAKIANIPKVLLKYRSSEKQISRGRQEEQLAIAVRERKKIITYLIKSDEINEVVEEFCSTRVFNISKYRMIRKQLLKSSPDNKQLLERLNLLQYSILISRPLNFQGKLKLLFQPELWMAGFNLKYRLRIIYNNLVRNKYPSLL